MMKKAISSLKAAKGILLGIIGDENDPASVAYDLLEEAIEELEPRWETPEQWEKRTGEKLDANAAVYFEWDRTVSDWGVCRYQSAIRDHDICVVATEAGPPPPDWKPGEAGK
jgi:hypothetical protein